jgi:hypothetical protein
LECDHDAVIAIHDGNFAWEVEKPSEKPDEAVKQEPTKKKEKSKKNKEEKSKPNGNGTMSPEGECTEEDQGLTEIKVDEEVIVLEDCLKNIYLEIKRGSLLGVGGSGNII